MSPVLLEAASSTSEDALEIIAKNTEGKSFAEIWADYRVGIISAVVIIVVGYLLAKILINALGKYLKNTGAAGASSKMLMTLVRIGLYFVIIVLAASALNIPMTSVIALFSAFALSFSLAIKDSLALFASGVIILVSKPFVSGDYVEIPSEGVIGIISSVGLIHTRLITLDNREVIIPNSIVTADTLINYSRMGLRRLDSTFSIAYEADFAQAKDIIKQVVEKEPMAEKEPAPFIMVNALSASSVDIICKVYVKWEDYEELRCRLNEEVKTAFDSEGVVIPFSQLDVHVNNG